MRERGGEGVCVRERWGGCVCERNILSVFFFCLDFDTFFFFCGGGDLILFSM